MDPSFYFFCALLVVIFSVVGYFLRSTIRELSTAAALNARAHAVAYFRSGALMAIAAGASFETAYQAVSPAMQATMSWAPYVIFYWKPITAALAILVAVLDRMNTNTKQP